ncbi:MAG: SAM-dependent methyltransferase [Simkaniaceae bacterium]|nr:SAM-dependent methyltransferase [Simkaniaceae bacterium]
MLYLLPNLLDENLDHDPFLPPSVGKIVSSLDGMIAESPRGARRYMKRFTDKFRDIPVHLLNKHTKEIDSLIAPLQKGETWGLIADAGLPVLADPGARLIRRLHTLKVPIETLPGPSSLVYALQLSGLPAQNFTFHGYPPKDEKTLKEKLRTLPKDQTHLFIEAPYRTDKFLKNLIYNLQGETDLSVSWNLTLPSQGVKTQKIAQWKKGIPLLGKVPAVFVVIGRKS